MGILLVVVGLIWAIIGIANIGMGWQKLSETGQSFSLMFNIILFVLPGLVVAGLGGLIRKKK